MENTVSATVIVDFSIVTDINLGSHEKDNKKQEAKYGRRKRKIAEEKGMKQNGFELTVLIEKMNEKKKNVLQS